METYPETIDVVITKELLENSGEFTSNSNCPLATFFKRKGFENANASLDNVIVEREGKFTTRYMLDDMFGAAEYYQLEELGITFKTTATLVKF